MNREYKKYTPGPRSTAYVVLLFLILGTSSGVLGIWSWELQRAGNFRQFVFFLSSPSSFCIDYSLCSIENYPSRETMQTGNMLFTTSILYVVSFPFSPHIGRSLFSPSQLHPPLPHRLPLPPPHPSLPLVRLLRHVHHRRRHPNSQGPFRRRILLDDARKLGALHRRLQEMGRDDGLVVDTLRSHHRPLRRHRC
jgi:hypothetical protein